VIFAPQFAGFDPFERSTYFGPFFDLGQVDQCYFWNASVWWWCDAFREFL